MPKPVAKKSPPRDVVSPERIEITSARMLHRFQSMRWSEAATVTDAFERRVENRYRDYLLALQPGTRISDGGQHIGDWITATFAVPFGENDGLHSHLAVLLMVVVGKLCKSGFLEPRCPEAPEREFVRTTKSAPGGEPWD